MAHPHSHHHSLDDAAGDRRVGAAVVVNLLLTLVQIVGGIVSGSLALIADALHNLSDGLSLVIAFIARRIARRGSDAQMTFGYARVEIVAALINYTTLIAISLYLAAEAAWRFIEPQGVDGWIVVVIAAVALAVDAATAVLTYTLSKSSMNMRAAFVHNTADAAGSLAVIVAGTLIILYDWRLVDPIVTLMISGYILFLSFREIGGVIRVLMLGSPPGIATEDVMAAVRAVEGVADVHRARFWQMHEHEAAFDAHVVVDQGAWSRADAIKEQVKATLGTQFGIHQSTLELECAVHACDGAPSYGTG